MGGSASEGWSAWEDLTPTAESQQRRLPASSSTGMHAGSSRLFSLYPARQAAGRATRRVSPLWYGGSTCIAFACTHPLQRTLTHLFFRLSWALDPVDDGAAENCREPASISPATCGIDTSTSMICRMDKFLGCISHDEIRPNLVKTGPVDEPISALPTFSQSRDDRTRYNKNKPEELNSLTCKAFVYFLRGQPLGWSILVRQ